MMLTEGRRRRIIHEEYTRLLEEDFRADVRRRIQEQLIGSQASEPIAPMQSVRMIGLSIVPVLIVVSEAVLLLK